MPLKLATTGRIEDRLPEAPSEVAGWQLSADTPAVLCYLDRLVPKAPPEGTPFDRAVVVAAGDHAALIMAGYRDQLPVKAP